MERARAVVAAVEEPVVPLAVAAVVRAGQTLDVVGTAGIILDATFMYQTQGCAGFLSLEEMRKSAARMIGLIVRGLRKG